jgi:adenylate kinase
MTAADGSAATDTTDQTAREPVTGPGTRLVILGKQGAGKGTQAERLAKNLGVPRISTGDMFRSAVRSGSRWGAQAAAFMDAGELVPDDVVVGMVTERLAQDDVQKRGFVLDGFPRSVAQAEALDRIADPELVISLEVPTEMVLRRLAGRRTCVECGANYGPDKPPLESGICDVCGGKVVVREDDTEAAISRRLAVYEERTAPLVAWYLASDRLAAVDGTGTPDSVTKRLLRAIETRLR